MRNVLSGRQQALHHAHSSGIDTAGQQSTDSACRQPRRYHRPATTVQQWGAPLLPMTPASSCLMSCCSWIRWSSWCPKAVARATQPEASRRYASCSRQGIWPAACSKGCQQGRIRQPLAVAQEPQLFIMRMHGRPGAETASQRTSSLGFQHAGFNMLTCRSHAQDTCLCFMGPPNTQ